VEEAFETETRAFKRSALYDDHHTSQRRSATTSFQMGLKHGIRLAWQDSCTRVAVGAGDRISGLPICPQFIAGDATKSIGASLKGGGRGLIPHSIR
jgi:hypothetical protein